MENQVDLTQTGCWSYDAENEKCSIMNSDCSQGFKFFIK